MTTAEDWATAEDLRSTEGGTGFLLSLPSILPGSLTSRPARPRAAGQGVDQRAPGNREVQPITIVGAEAYAQFREESLRLFQIGGVETFGEPAAVPA